MISKITFLNDHWFWPVMAGAFILMTVFLWKEFSQAGRRRLPLKIILSILAIAALVFIALKPAFQTSGSGGKIVLLTPGYEKSQVDSLQKEYQGIKVLDYGKEHAILREIGESEQVFILGNGVREYDLHQLENIPVVFLPGTSPDGVMKLKFPEKLEVGVELNIQGIYRNPRADHQLTLQSPGGLELDSINLVDEEEQSFSLKTELKAAGNFVYYLTEKDPDGEVISSNPVPVQVEEKTKLRVLILNSFPTFETRYLKNFLAEAGHEVVVRSRITTGRFKYEYFNTVSTQIGNLSQSALEAYDLLVIDAQSLRSLSGAQSQGLQKSVREEGLGVFVQPDEAFFNNPGEMLKMSFERQQRTKVSLDEWPETDLSVFPFSIMGSSDQQNIYSSGNSAITGYSSLGRGRIGTSVLSDTWQLVLEGEDQIYKTIWSRALEKLSKKKNIPVQWLPEERVVYPHEPFHFRVRSAVTNPEIINSQGGIIPMVQNVNLPEIWSGTLWPREQGWNSLQTDTTTVFNFYVFDEGSWNSLIAQNTLEENQRYFESSAESVQGHIQLQPLDPIWFYGLFLICMGGLWLEPKFT